MTSSFLLDTNAVIARFSGEASVLELLINADELYISTTVLGELFHGAQKSMRVAENIERIERAAAEITILDCDIETARWYGKVHHGLSAKGRPIPQNDIWIAAVALQHGLTLLTKDQHFQNVDDLSIQSW